MTSLEAYKKFLLKINKNDSNSNVSIPKGEFVEIFNEQARRWLREKIKVKESSDQELDISEVYITDYEIQPSDSSATFVEFSLPPDFFDYSSSYCNANKEITFTAADGTFYRYTCEGIVYLWEIKNKNINTLLISENDKPSFEFEESFMVLSSTKVKVYKTDFNLTKLTLSYYKNPPLIDIAGYIKLDRTKSTNIDPIFTDVNTDEIVNRCAVEVTRNYENVQQFQLSKDRVANED